MALHQSSDDDAPTPLAPLMREKLVRHTIIDPEFHSVSGLLFAHEHTIPEDAPLDLKQGLGAHIAMWHE